MPSLHLAPKVRFKNEDYDRQTRAMSGVETLRALADFEDFLEFVASGGKLHVWAARFQVGNLSIHRWIKEQPRDTEGLTGAKRYQQAMEMSATVIMDQAAEVLERSFNKPYVTAQIAYARHSALMASMRATRYRADGEVLKSAPPSLFDEQLAESAQQEAALDVTPEQMLRAGMEILRGAGYEIEDEETPKPTTKETT